MASEERVSETSRGHEGAARAAVSGWGWRRAQVREQLGALQAACGVLRASADLMTVLRAVLLTGNHLNEGTARGAADGASPLASPPAWRPPAPCLRAGGSGAVCTSPPWVAGPGELGQG